MPFSTQMRVAVFPPVEPTDGFPYKIIEVVGEGSMGMVYRAEDVELARDVAIKVMRPAFLRALSPRDAKEATGRFIQEAKAAAALSHPGITVVHRVGTVSGQPYFAMEWLDGWTVEQLLATHDSVKVSDAIRLALKVLDALGAAHKAGIIHRDIKPANLIVTRERRVKVTDFGIARVQGSVLAQTQAGLIVGTPQYAAPEQLAGKPIDGRADLYALATVMYELVTGRPPFVAESAYELVRLVQTTDAPPPSTLTDVPAEFDRFMVRALAKTPESRFADAQEMAAALRSYVAGRGSRVSAAQKSVRVTAPTRLAVPLVRVAARTVPELVAATVRTWPATPVGLRSVEYLFERLLDRPLHAPAFCGALVAGKLCMLVCDGIIYAACDVATGALNDAVLDVLPTEIDATLYAVPDGTAPQIVALLASLLLPTTPTLSGLDASFADLPLLAERLCNEKTDGAIRFVDGEHLGFALFNRGQRVIDIFSEGWDGGSTERPWEEWIGESHASASVEPLHFDFPSITFRQQLADIALEVVRPQSVTESGRIRSDAVAEARALELRPLDEEHVRLRRGGSTLHGLVANDPIFPLVRWVLTELPLQFNQFGRSGHWKGLVGSLPGVVEVRLHHRIEGADSTMFDAVFRGPDQQVHQIVDRVAVGDRRAVEAFMTRAAAVKASHEELGGAVLVAPSFSEDALEAYLDGLRKASRQTLRTRLETSLSHREGFIRVGRGGFHVLLIEDGGEHPRPLVPEQ